MQTSPLRSIVSAALALWLGVLACGSSSSAEPTATPLPRPTQKPQATATKAKPKPTATPQASAGAIVLAAKPFAHDSGGFTIYLPDGWEVKEKNNSVFAEPVDHTLAVDMGFTHSGIELSATEFETYVDSYEANRFGKFADYEVLEDKTPQADGSVGVFKTLTLSGGTAQTVLTYYWQQGVIVYDLTLWADSDIYEDSEAGLLEVANSLKVTPEALAEVEPYRVGYKFNGADLFTFQVPYGWTHRTTTKDEITLDKFTSPDGAATVDNIIDLSGAYADLEAARRVAVGLLTDTYEVTEADITAEKEQDDGSIRLSWETATLKGSTFYEVRDGNFLFLNFVVYTDLFDTYSPVWTLLLDTYRLSEE